MNQAAVIRVSVKWFAAFREITGTPGEQCETDATSPAELFDQLRLSHANLGERGAALVAINDKVSDWDTPLNDGDEVLFFPPVAGG